MLLLDSQVLVWVLTGTRRLGRRALTRIRDTPVVHFSAATIFELTIKSMRGRLQVPHDLSRAVRDQGLVELPISAAHAAAVGDFPELVRHDPFDRLLVAQAHCAGMDLLTADGVLLDLARDFIVDARQ